VGSEMMDYFYTLSEQKYEELFLDGIEELKINKEKITKQFILCSKQRDMFKISFNKISNFI